MYAEGDRVRWPWRHGHGEGTVQSVFTERTTRRIDGREITRDASELDPAYYIRAKDGNNVLKLHSEIERA